MKISVKILILILGIHLFSPSSALAEEETGTNFGPNKAVVAFDKENGFQLSEKAIQNLGVAFKGIEGSGPWKVSANSIIHLKQSSGVYRRVDDWIMFVLVKVNQKIGSDLLISSDDLQSGDEIATSGAHFLRMTDADLNSGTVDSCAQ